MKPSLLVIPLFVLSGILFVLLLGSCKADTTSGTIDASSAENTDPLGVGATIPEVKVQTIRGKSEKLTSLIKDKPTVLLFYRGGWCPYCNTHLGKIQTVEGDLQKLGYQILAISPDRPEKLDQTASKNKLGYRLLSDSTMAAARAFGLSFKVDEATREKYRGYGIDLVDASGETHSLLPVPAAYVIDAGGFIRFAFADPDYKKRVSVEALLTQAKRAIKTPLSVYDFAVEDAKGETVELDQYRGKPLLIVNTASKCGFTRQYAGLETLHKNYKDKGLVVLGFPCNQFGRQEPGTNEQIQSFCQRNYGVTFPVMAKIEVNGDQAHPLYKHLKSQAGGIAGTDAIKWNFTKFLVDKNGRVVDRFASKTKPAALTDKIENLLQK